MVDNLITLYEHDEREFTTNGLGSLNDALACSVREERNGEFELTMEYPVTGRHFSDLVMRRIIFAKPNPHTNAQPFRIYSISKPINGRVSIAARHISYDLDGYALAPFDRNGLIEVFDEMNRQMSEPWNSDKPVFHFSTIKTGTMDAFNLVAPCSMRAILGGSEGTILDHWPGEYEWDVWEVKYHQNRGSDRGVTIEYGKNLTDLQQDESCDNCWTSVYPYYYMEPQEDADGNITGGLVELDEKILQLPGTYNYSRTLILDLTTEFQEMPTKEDLLARAQQYIEENEIGSPKVSLTVSFIPLSETTAYSKLKILEEVKLCDTVHVYFPRLGVSSTSTCISTTYNALTDKYTQIELGEARSDLASTIAGQGNDTEKKLQDALGSTSSFLEESIKRQTKMITGNLGGYVVLYDANGDGKPDELLIMDHENVKDAVNIWRANQLGVGHSSTGYNGEYTTGWTMDGHFNASLITVGELWANIIKAGILSDKNGYNYWNMETGEFRLTAAATVDGQTIPSIAEEKANSALKNAKAYSDESIGGFIQDTYNPRIAEMQKQLDGQVETYYYDYEPTLQNEPASLWTNDTEKARHEGDLFYWKAKGYAYRFFKDEDTWKWQLVQDTDITQALAKADAAQDTADHKRRVFVDTPTPPYDVGDLWVQGPQGDIYRCEKSKDVNTKYDFGDWIKASKYTDDSTFTAFLNGEYSTTIDQLKQQDDQKSETWYQKQDPSTAWKDTTTKNNHVGDMWYCSNSEDKTYGLKYWVWNGTSWDEMKTEPPKDLFDRFDGKAKIFVNTPTTPYQVGDLWFQSETSDIMTCINGRDSGSYVPDDWVKRNKYTDDSAFNNFFNGEYKTTIADLQAQDDKKAETWYQSSDPSEDWSDTTTKNNHKGDMWYCSDSSDVTHYGKYWIWSGTTWTEMITNPPQAVFDRIDGKAQIFVGTSDPEVPYHKGDLWFKDANSDIMTCVKTRTSGLYDASEWKKYNKYTDNSELDSFLTGEYKTTIDQLKTQSDKKAETWFQNADPSADWTTPELKNEHVGDLWYCTDSSSIYAGQYLRWNGTTWQEIETIPPKEILNTINGKAQIFTTDYPPEPPYHKNDLWFKDANSPIYISTEDREADQVYNEHDWVKRDNYINAAESKTQTQSWFSNSLTQSALFNKLTNNGTIQGIFMQADGQLYMNASYINSGTMSANYIYGGVLRVGYGYGNGEIQVYYTTRDGTVGAQQEYKTSILRLNSLGLSTDGSVYSTAVTALNNDDDRYYPGDGSPPPTSIPVMYAECNSRRHGAIFPMGYTTLSLSAISGAANSVMAISTNSYDERLVYTYETARPMFGDIGSGVLDEEGICVIDIHDLFSETVDLSAEYYVFLQKEGPGDIWVDSKKPTYFIVKGTPNLRFSWELKAHQVGVSTVHLEKFDSAEKILPAIDYERQAEIDREELIKEREET